MRSFILFVSLIVCPVDYVLSKKFDYYWRDYNGEIPGDAVSGGTDTNGITTYIAQTYIPKHGVLIASLSEGKKSVTACRHGIHKSDTFIQILCSNHPEKLTWVATTATKLHLHSINRHLVVGGTENGRLLNIGRTSYKGEVIVGKVCGYNIENSLLYFPYNDEEWSQNSYEVLVYDHTANTIFPKITTY